MSMSVVSHKMFDMHVSEFRPKLVGQTDSINKIEKVKSELTKV